jgi:hypothetical protein
LKRFTIRSLVPLPGFVKLGESTSAAGGLPCELELKVLEAAEQIDIQNSGQGSVDVVWVIDNSGSMSEEAANVRNNFQNFVNSLGAKSDLHLALLSSKSQIGRGTSVSLPEVSNSTTKMVQVDHPVGSTNALAIAALASCAKPEKGAIIAKPSTKAVCGQEINENIEAFSSISSFSGKLVDFFRKESKKVFVVVTDDNARGVDATNFRTVMANGSAGKEFTLFAFRGTKSKNNCNVASPGMAYEQLAKETGGEVFDICDTDWSENFDKLTAGIVKIANVGYKIKQQGVKKVLSIAIDGKVIEVGKYTVSGQDISFADGILVPGQKTIEVKFQYNP